MSSTPSSTHDTLGNLRESARRGDWATAGRLAADLARELPPATAAEAALYLRDLRQALDVARASRAQAAATLRRVRAAASFANGKILPF